MNNVEYSSKYEKIIFKKFLFVRDEFTWKKPFRLNYVVLSQQIL